jgi:hypothetical protein
VVPDADGIGIGELIASRHKKPTKLKRAILHDRQEYFISEHASEVERNWRRQLREHDVRVEKFYGVCAELDKRLWQVLSQTADLNAVMSYARENVEVCEGRWNVPAAVSSYGEAFAIVSNLCERARLSASKWQQELGNVESAQGATSDTSSAAAVAATVDSKTAATSASTSDIATSTSADASSASTTSDDTKAPSNHQRSHMPAVDADELAHLRNVVVLSTQQLQSLTTLK